MENQQNFQLTFVNFSAYFLVYGAIVFLTRRQDGIPLRCTPYRQIQVVSYIKTVLCWWFCQRVKCIDNQHVRIPYCYLSGQPQRLGIRRILHIRWEGKFTSVQERCLTFTWYGLDISLVYPSGEEFKWFLPAFTALRGRGGGRHPVKDYTFDMECAEGVDSDVVLWVAQRLHILHPTHSGSREACNQESF
jgi:hypothetical protein